MPILSVQPNQPGQSGAAPRLIYIATNDTLAEVTATGYLNGIARENIPLSEDMMALVSTKTSPNATATQVSWLEVSRSGQNWSLVSTAGPGSVTLPTIANHIATYTNTLGALSEDPATAISGGNLQAGLSGTAGYLVSFPATAARGSMRFVAANSAGDTVTTITNASQAGARTYTIPDGGQSASSFLLSDSGSTQTIATGNLTLTLGNLTLSAGSLSVAAGITSVAGNITSGSSGDAGTFISFPATAANGTLILAAANAGGAFNTTISNGTMGQSTVYTIPDAANAAGRFLAAAGATPFVSGNFPVASGTGGLMVDSGLAAANIQNRTNIIAATTADIGGGGAGPISVVVAGLTAASVVVATIESSSNAVSVAQCTATATGFDITFSADPGAACTVNYVAFIAAQ